MNPTSEDIEVIIKHGYDVACNILDDNINEVASYDFSENFKRQITSVLNQDLSYVFPDLNVEELVDYCVLNILSIIHDTFIPKRSHYGTYTSGMPNITHTAEKIQALRDVYQPEQRTDEWYHFRYNLITASNAWKIFDTAAALNQIIYEKCKPLDTTKYQSVNINSAMHWGQKYEPLSVMWYEFKYNTQIEDFGCIPHPKVKCLGASPDGINVDNTSERYGRMLEIKILYPENLQVYRKRIIGFKCSCKWPLAICLHATFWKQYSPNMKQKMTSILMARLPRHLIINSRELSCLS